MATSVWNWNSRTQMDGAISRFQDSLYEKVYDSKTEFRRLAGLGLGLTDFTLRIVKITTRIGESLIKGVGLLFKGIIESKYRTFRTGVSYLLSTPFLVVGSSILLTLSVATLPIALPAHLVWCAIDPDSYSDANLKGMDWDWSSRTQCMDWITDQQMSLYEKVKDSQGDYKKALGLPLLIAEKILDVAKIIAWVAEPIIKGVGNILCFSYLRECHLKEGVQQLITAPFLAAFAVAYLALSAFILPFELVLIPVEFSKKPNFICNERIKYLIKWK